MLDNELSELSPLCPRAHTHIGTKTQNARERKKPTAVCPLVGTKWHGFSGKTNIQEKLPVDSSSSSGNPDVKPGESLTLVPSSQQRKQVRFLLLSQLFPRCEPEMERPLVFPTSLWSQTKTKPSSSLNGAEESAAEELLLQPLQAKEGQRKKLLPGLTKKFHSRQAKPRPHGRDIRGWGFGKAHWGASRLPSTSRPTLKLQQSFLGMKHAIRE